MPCPRQVPSDCFNCGAKLVAFQHFRMRCIFNCCVHASFNYVCAYIEVKHFAIVINCILKKTRSSQLLDTRNTVHVRWLNSLYCTSPLTCRVVLTKVTSSGGAAFLRDNGSLAASQNDVPSGRGGEVGGAVAPRNTTEGDLGRYQEAIGYYMYKDDCSI